MITIGTESLIYRMIKNGGLYGTPTNESTSTPFDDHARHTMCLARGNRENRILNVTGMYSDAYSSVCFFFNIFSYRCRNYMQHDIAIQLNDTYIELYLHRAIFISSNILQLFSHTMELSSLIV